MACRQTRGYAVFVAIWLAASVVAADVRADEADPPLHVELFGRLSAESRVFPAAAAFPGQRSAASGFTAEPTLHVENGESWSFTLVPFLRYDRSDPRRTHFDVREAQLLLFGDVNAGGWEVRLGAGQVFWGVAESQRLVDIVNQVDLVEHPNGQAKLGQPMAHVTWFGNWGAWEVVAMSFHRSRTFAGDHGRLRPPLAVDHEHVQYESAAERLGLDVASRYSQSLGPLDLGVSVFDGTSREPFLQPAVDDAGEPTLLQYYGQIRQLGLDVQLTVGSWLLKTEAIGRRGAPNLVGVEQDYVAATVGGEYTFYTVADSSVDVTLLGEWSYDSRGASATFNRSPNVLENDVFFATRLAFNDIQSTEFTTSILADAKRATRALALAFDRRISSDWSLHAEAVALLSVDEADLLHDMRHDSFIDMSLVYSF